MGCAAKGREREQPTDLFGWTRKKTMILERAGGGYDKMVDQMASCQRAKFCVELRERADLRTDLFGWTREQTMIFGRAEGSFNKSVDKMASYQ